MCTWLGWNEGYRHWNRTAHKFTTAIADNHKEINQFGVSFKKPITISVKVEGKHQIVIDNANAIGYLATTIANNLKEIEEHPLGAEQQVSISTPAEEKG